MQVNAARRSVRSGDRGVSAVLVALLLTSIFALGAFAVDLGSAFTERRHDQNTVDAAVMSGLVRGALAGGVVNDIVAEVRTKVDTTLGKPVSADEWAACKDSGQLEFTTAELKAANNPLIDPVTECISFSRGFEELRVRLPDQHVPVVFGGVIGSTGISVNAIAHGRITDAGIGGPPFIALSTATQGDFVCLRTSSPGEPITLMDGRGPKVAPLPGTRADPCDSAAFAASTSSFGTLLPYRYEAGPTWAACSRQGNVTVTQAIQIGIDHIMGVFPNGYSPTLPASATRVDGAGGCKAAFPNTFELDTGFAAGELRCALISRSNSTDCDGIPARFHQGPNYMTGSNQQKFVGEYMDNVAPWAYLRPAQLLYDEGSPPACVAAAAQRTSDNFDLATHATELGFTGYVNVVDADWDHYDRFDVFTDCLKKWSTLKQPASGTCAGSTPPAACYWPRNIMFDKMLGDSARFGFVPQVWESVLDSQTQYVHIEGFLPTFMYRLYTSSQSTMCDPADGRATTFAVHDAGQVFAPNYSCGSANGNAKVDRLASMIMSCGMLPRDLCDKETGMPKASGIDIYDFQLVR